MSLAHRVRDPTPLHRCKGGQFVAHVAALPGNPYERSAVEPVHLKAEHSRGRNHLAHSAGDAVKTVLATAGYNLRLLLNWLRLLLRAFLAALFGPPTLQAA